MNDSERLNQMRDFVAALHERDGDHMETVKKAAGLPEGVDPAAAGFESSAGMPESAGLEAIISLARPVFAIAADKVDPSLTGAVMGTGTGTGTGTEITAIEKLVKDRAATINKVIPSVGRIDLTNNDEYPWIGTGWIIDSDFGDDIIVTNAHVAVHFAERSGDGYVFSPAPFNPSRRQSADLNFRWEITETPPRTFKITDVIYIGTPGQMDVAFLRVARTNATDRITAPIKLATAPAQRGLEVATIGYPGTDRGSYDVETLLRMFGNVFDRKRFSPGKIVGMEKMGLMHDCSTMPGSSGSILFDTKTGNAVGLHFQGIPFKSNHAVPADAIARLIKERPWHGRTRSRASTSAAGTKKMGTEDAHGKIVTAVDANGVRILVPLEITVRIGAAQPVVGLSSGAAAGPVKTDDASAEAAAAFVKPKLATHPHVVDVRATYLYEDGLLTHDKGVVVTVRPEASRDPSDYGLAPTIDGVPVSIEMADLESLARSMLPGRPEAALEAAELESLEAPAKMQKYRRDLTDPKFNLNPITDNMKITLHVSPEAGWRELSKFFAANAYDQITIGIYHFTAPHVIEAVRKAIKPATRRLTMTIDRKKGDDIGGKGTPKEFDWPEEKMLKTLTSDVGKRFKWVAASISGPNKLFHSAYHIKVAVLSGKSGSGGLKDKMFWLSSGNWQSSNQAPFEDDEHPIDQLTWNDVKEYDRDWHAIVENEKLTRLFRNHLEQDYVDDLAVAGQEAPEAVVRDFIVPDDYYLEAPRAVKFYKAFPPKLLNAKLRVQAVLTPDNYPDVVVPLIKNASDSILFINQSFDIKEDTGQIPPHFKRLLDALLERQKKGLDVRIIFRSGYGKERDLYRRAVEFGFDKNRIKFFGKCHTKGIVVDKKRVLLGSQNWTGAGTLPNRDASLLIDSEEGARYFADIFEFDWTNVATNRVAPDPGRTKPVHRVSRGEEAVVPAGYHRVSWHDRIEN